MRFRTLAILPALLLLASSVRAAGPAGADNGWAIDNQGHTFYTTALCRQMSQGETGWIRIEMRLIPGHNTWDAAMLRFYDTAVNNLRAEGIQTLLLIDGGSWPGRQSDWCAGNHEHAAGNGDNSYVDAFADHAVVPIVKHFRGRVRLYEIWNEPNAWTSSPSPGVFTGGTFLYPSNYSWMLNKSWIAVHKTSRIRDATLFFGGVFGHNIGGHRTYSTAGAQYIDDTYRTGIYQVGSFSGPRAAYGSYPLDGVGEHLYIDQGGLTSAAHVRQYLDWVRSAYTRYEGDHTRKNTFITEIGWPTTTVSPEEQAANLASSFEAIGSRPFVQVTTWFQWQDNPPGHLFYGVRDGAGRPKPSYLSYQRYERYEGSEGSGEADPGIARYFQKQGQAALGSPYDAGAGPRVYVSGAGRMQDFEGGSHGRLGVMTSAAGTYEVNSLHGMWGYYRAHNGITAYGYPTDNEHPFRGGTRQDFQNGTFIWDASGLAGHLKHAALPIAAPHRGAGEHTAMSTNSVAPSSHSSSRSHQLMAYVGCYTKGKEQGIYLFHLDTDTGVLTPAGPGPATMSPSFLAIHPGGRFLYAVNESENYRGSGSGAVSAFAIDPHTGALTFLNEQSSHGSGPCHIVVDSAGKNALVANYNVGSVACLPILSDGRLGEATAAIQHHGSSVVPDRQEGPHAHSMNLNAANTIAYAVDLGLDKVFLYRFNPANGTLVPADPPFASVAPGSGPRHFAFSKNGRFAYVINELNSTVTAFSCSQESGALTTIQTLTTLPEGYTGVSHPAEVQVSPDGRFLYGSNRGHDSIAIYRLDAQTGLMTPVDIESTLGKEPRHFRIDPSGQFLLAANQNSNTVVVFRVDRETGKLIPTGHSVDVPSPVCVVMMPAPTH